MNRFLSSILLILLTPFSLLAQDELKKIILPSPTVSALAKYGDQPVSYFTGTPSVSIPLHEIKTGDFTLPVSLSYHAAGVKVEEMASWVGLGWSLNAGGIISRSVRGLPDETGYMDPGDNKISDIRAQTYSQQEEFFRALVNSVPTVDLEPDVFYFNFGNYSGKFYYNQESGNLVSIPQKPIFFDKSYFLSTGKWKVKTEDGTEYQFDKKEENVSSSACGGIASPNSITITGWFLTKIVTPIAKKEINFNYTASSYTIKNLNSQTILEAPYNSVPCVPRPGQPEICESYSDYSGFRLTSISYDDGEIEFKASTNRLDLLNDKRLDTIKIYKAGLGTPFKQFALGYGYFNNQYISEGYSADALSYLIRLKLNSVTEIGEGGNSLPPFVLEYKSESSLPSRMSYAQDNWGFYNGRNANTHLVPPMWIDVLYYSGADRTTDSVFTDTGVISKISYPTGGYTDFLFENHKVRGHVPYSQNQYMITRSVLLDTLTRCDPGIAKVFCKPLVINNHLTGSTKGAYVSIKVLEINNCSYCPSASSCAVLGIMGDTYSVPITCDVVNLFIPNGEYVLKADFSGGNADFGGFAIQVTWFEYSISDSVNVESKVGGLRIKKITDNDGLGNVKSRFFTYKLKDNITSSGVLVSAKPVYEYVLPCGAGSETGEISGSYFVRKSYSNIPLGTTQGSHIGYDRVEVSLDEGNSQGASVYSFSNASDNWCKDIENRSGFAGGGTEYPFAPVTNLDYRRGLLVKEEQYERSMDSLRLIRKTENEYRPLSTFVTDSKDFPLYSETIGIKLGINGKFIGSYNPGLYAIYTFYPVVSEWIYLSKTTTTEIDEGGNALKTETYMDYANSQHMQITKQKVILSDNSELSSHFKYPLDYTFLSGTHADSFVKGIQKLQTDHFITPVIEKYVTRKHGASEQVVQGILTSFNSSNAQPSALYNLNLTAPKSASSYVESSIDGSWNFVKDNDYEPRVFFGQYDDVGNLLEQRKDVNVYTSYLWGYNSIYPIAEVINAKRNDVFHTSFEDSGGSTTAMTGNKSFNGGTFTKPLSGLTNGTYTLSYWQYTSGQWVFHSSSVTVSSGTYSISISGQLDEVRFHPSNAQMMTYTYDPQIGMTSACDANNIVSYYEYDAFSRLKRIRDKAGNILKLMNYNLMKRSGSTY